MVACPEGEKHLRAAEAAEAQLRQQIAAVNRALNDAMAAAARMDFDAIAAAVSRAIRAAAACADLKATVNDEDAAAASEFKKCADRAVERGDLRGAVDLYRAARACGATDAGTAEAATEELYKRSEREHDDRIKPASRPQPGVIAAPGDPAAINVAQEQAAAAKDEQAAESPTNTPEQAAAKLISAAKHHRAVARNQLALGDPCVAADELAAASDDYAKAAAILLDAGNPDAAFWDQLEAAQLAEEAAKLYEQCAQDADGSGRQRTAMRFWSKADTCWERVWLFWDRMRRYWQARRLRARDEGDPDEVTYKRNAEEAAKRAAEAERRSLHARDRIEADADALKSK
jgi:hypothetical protein